jgi:1-phosphatidylinositol-3-phosphate 5-kinase
MKGMLLFTEVANSLKKIRSQFTSRTVNLRGTSLDLSDIEEMLKHETSDFEVCFSLSTIF